MRLATDGCSLRGRDEALIGVGPVLGERARRVAFATGGQVGAFPVSVIRAVETCSSL